MATNVSNGFRHPLGSGFLTEAQFDADGFYVAQNFNEFNPAIGANGSFHLGEDWNGDGGGNTDLGLPVFAISNGEVTQANFLASLGNYVVIRHVLPTPLFIDGASRTEIVSLYAHLQTFPAVTVGQVVSIGTQIGNVGFSGDAGGLAHLHFEIRLGTQFTDPDGYNPTGAPTGWVDPTNFINDHRTLSAPAPSDTVREGTDTTATLSVGGSVNGTIDAAPISGDGVTSNNQGGFVDKDWYAVTLAKGHIYKFQGGSGSISTGSLAIGVYNSSGTLINGPTESSSPSITIDTTSQSNATQTYYIAASAGGPEPQWRTATGNFSISLTDQGTTTVGGTDNILDNANTQAVLSSIAVGSIDAEPADGSTAHVSDGQGGFVDKDWFRVSLEKGKLYTFTGSAASVSTGLIDISLYGQNGTQIHAPVEGSTPSFTFDTTYQSSTSQTYYLAVSAGGSEPAWRTASGGYSIGLSSETVVGATDRIPGTIQTTLQLPVGTTTGTIDATDVNGGPDDDYYKVTLTGGHKYTFIASAGVSAADTLDSIIIRLRDANGNVLLTGDRTASGPNPSFDYTASSMLLLATVRLPHCP